MDQFHELKEYFRNVVAPTYSEWKDVPEDEKMQSKSIFIRCIGRDLIDYINIDDFSSLNIQRCFDINYKKNNLNHIIPFTGYILLDTISKKIDDPVSKIFYECTPSGEKL